MIRLSQSSGNSSDLSTKFGKFFENILFNQPNPYQLIVFSYKIALVIVYTCKKGRNTSKNTKIQKF